MRAKVQDSCLPYSSLLKWHECRGDVFPSSSTPTTYGSQESWRQGQESERTYPASSLNSIVRLALVEPGEWAHG